MIFSRNKFAVVVLAGVIGLAGCPGTEDSEINDDGIVIHFGETHLEDRVAATRTVPNLANSGSDTVVALAGGYDKANVEHHDIIDGATPSHLVSVYRAFLVVDEVHLEECTSVSKLPQRIFESIFPRAMAHAGHGSEPVGDRSLNKPNVIDIVTQDEFILALGDRSMAPGTYCGMHVSFARVDGDAYGVPVPAAASSDDPTTVPEIPDMTGKMFAMRADYCSEASGGTCITRTKIDIDDTGLTIPEEAELEFEQPLVVNATTRTGYVVFGLAYGEWLSGVDATLLPTDAEERQKLLENIVSSVHVYAKGNGDLPVNVVVTGKAKAQ